MVTALLRYLRKRSLFALRKELEAAADYRFVSNREMSSKWIMVYTIEHANPLTHYKMQPVYAQPPAQPVLNPYHINEPCADPDLIYQYRPSRCRMR